MIVPNLLVEGILIYGQRGVAGNPDHPLGVVQLVGNAIGTNCATI